MSISNWVVTHDSATAAALVGGASTLGPVGAISIGADAVPGAELTKVLAKPPAGVLMEGYAPAIAEFLAGEGAHLVLFGGDTASRLLAGLVAAGLKTSVRNITSIDGDVVTCTVFGGLALATEKLGPGPAVLIVGPGALPEPAGALAPGKVEQWDAAAASPGLKVVDMRPKATQGVNLAAAKRVIGVGRGFAAEADLDLARALATKLDAEVACSRPIAEGVHWLPAERYIGVSGATIRPDVYVAVGISGQVQHMVGVGQAKTIVAINKDKVAPIFAHADYGIVGDLYQVLPALTDAL